MWSPSADMAATWAEAALQCGAGGDMASSRSMTVVCDFPKQLPDEVVLEDSSEPELDEEIASIPAHVFESRQAEQIRTWRDVQGGGNRNLNGDYNTSAESFAADSQVSVIRSMCPGSGGHFPCYLIWTSTLRAGHAGGAANSRHAGRITLKLLQA